MVEKKNLIREGSYVGSSHFTQELGHHLQFPVSGKQLQQKFCHCLCTRELGIKRFESLMLFGVTYAS